MWRYMKVKPQGAQRKDTDSEPPFPFCAIETSGCRVLLAATSSWNDFDARSSPANQKHCFCFHVRQQWKTIHLLILLVVNYVGHFGFRSFIATWTTWCWEHKAREPGHVVQEAESSTEGARNKTVWRAHAKAHFCPFRCHFFAFIIF